MKMPFFVLLVSCALLASCNGSSTPRVASSSDLTPATTTPMPTITASRTSTLAPPAATSTLTLSPTSSPIPLTRTRRPTSTPSSTPAPTLSSIEEQMLVLGMLRNNGGCQLPCWWGVTPGETRWQIVEAFFLAHGKRIGEYHYSNKTNYTIAFDLPEHMSLWNSYYVSNDVVDSIFIQAVPPIHDDEFAYGDIQFIKDLAPYSLSQMLTTYGQPAQILLGVDSKTPWVPFELLLFYPEQGVLVRYSGSASRGEETFQVCPYHSEIALWLWSATSDMALENIHNENGLTAAMVADIPSLEVVTGITNEEFYQTFIQSDVGDCFGTLVEVWQ